MSRIPGTRAESPKEVSMAVEPLHADDIEGHATLQASTRLDIAAGESVYSYQQFTNFIAHAAARGLRVAPHAGDMAQVHPHLVGTGLTQSPLLIEFIPWTQDAYVERSVVSVGYLERPQAPGASTAIDPRARRNWKI